MSEQFASNAEEIRFYTKELLQDRKEHSMEEIQTYVGTHAPNGRNFTRGMYAGAIRDLVGNSRGRYINPRRGYYQMAGVVVESSGQGIQQKAVKVLEEACKALREACTVSIIGISQQELETAKQVEVAIKDLENHIKALQKN